MLPWLYTVKPRQWTALVMLCIFYSTTTNASTGPLFEVTLSGATLTITPVFNPKAPNKIYAHAGVKINNPAFAINHCTPLNNHFCTFPVSTDAPARLAIAGPSGSASLTVCLNVTGNTANCETHAIEVPRILFITQTSYSGNLAGTAGADIKCNDQAYIAGSEIPPGRQFKALLLSPTRYPCSRPNTNTTGSCNGAYAKDWPLTPGTRYYHPNGRDVFNTVNAQGVFNGDVITFRDPTGEISVADFWSGVQSVQSTPDGFQINAWAFADMNPTTDHAAYNTNLAYCNHWTSSESSQHGSVGSAGRYPGSLLGPVAASTWGNYYQFADDAISYLFNTFAISAYYHCDGQARLVCVG